MSESITVRALALCSDDGHLLYEPEAGYLIDTERAWLRIHGRDRDELVEVTITYTPLPPKPPPPPRKRTVSRKQVFETACPKCRAKAKEYCLTLNENKRRRIGTFHAERRDAARIRTHKPAP